MPFDLEAARLVKNATVRGIIGNVQGMIRPSNPPRNPRKKILSIPREPSAPVPPHELTGLARSMLAFFNSLAPAADCCNCVDFGTQTPSGPRPYRKATSTGPTTDSFFTA